MDESEITLPAIEPVDAPTALSGAVEVFPARSADALATSHRSLQMLYAYWAARCGGRPMPSRTDIDPVDLKSVLPMLILIDVGPDPRRYVYRLVGTREVEMRSGDPTGKAVEEAYYGESAEETIRYLDRVVETRQPLVYRGTYKPLRTRTQRDDILFLPLSNDGERVTMIMVLSHTDWLKDELRV